MSNHRRLEPVSNLILSTDWSLTDLRFDGCVTFCPNQTKTISCFRIEAWNTFSSSDF